MAPSISELPAYLRDLTQDWSRPRKMPRVFQAVGLEPPARLHQGRFDELVEALSELGVEASADDGETVIASGDPHPGISTKLRLRRRRPVELPKEVQPDNDDEAAPLDFPRLVEFRLRNFKSFKDDSHLPLSSLTLLIGSNASGKSNALEALQLMSWMASGQRLWSVGGAAKERKLALRGAITDLTWNGENSADGSIGLGCRLGEDQQGHPLLYSVELEPMQDTLRIVDEKLEDPKASGTLPLYRVVEPARTHGREMIVEYNNFSRGKNKPQITCVDEQPVFMQLETPARFGATHERSREIIPKAVRRLREALSRILFLDPVPRAMRDYSFVTATALTGDGSNLSGVLHELTDVRGLKAEVLGFIKSLPEQDIVDVDYVKTPRNEVMVELKESFGGRKRFQEAALLSDGTLRVLAIAAAMLSVPEGTLVVIEEIDNGVHPSRAQMLLERIRDVSTRRHLRVLLTTHNPALLDSLPGPSLPNVVACFRDPETGSSRLVKLEELTSYPDIIARGPLGQLVTRGVLDRYLKDRRSEDEQRTDESRWMDDLFGEDLQ